jgi:hypothetical protein
VKPDDTVQVSASQLANIYLDGFTSGICSALQTFSQLAENQIIHIAQRLAEGMWQNEKGAALLLNEIQERLDDTDSGPKKHVVGVDLGRIPLGPEMN